MKCGVILNSYYHQPTSKKNCFSSLIIKKMMGLKSRRLLLSLRGKKKGGTERKKREFSPFYSLPSLLPEPSKRVFRDPSAERFLPMRRCLFNNISPAKIHILK
jgi:hypothetical protein